MTTAGDLRLREILAVTSDAAVTVHDLAYVASRLNRSADLYARLLALVPTLRTEAGEPRLSERLRASGPVWGYPSDDRHPFGRQIPAAEPARATPETVWGQLPERAP